MPHQPITVTRKDTIGDALRAIDRSAIGMVALIGDDGQFLRTVTDGDLRRLMIAGQVFDAGLDTLPDIRSVTATETMTLSEMLTLMNQYKIDHLPVVDGSGRLIEVAVRRELDQRILLSTPHLGSEEMEFVLEAFSTNWIAPLGPNVDAFEKAIADLVGVPEACAVVSGTAAIHLGLRLLGVERDDTVFVSDFTFIASVSPIVYQGARPVFIDSEPDSWNMSPVALKRALEGAAAEGALPKAIIIVNLYGQSADMDPLLALADEYGVPVLEDAAESLGATYKGKASGTFGAFGAFSFNGNKIITTSGGGMLVGRDPELIRKARMLASQAREPVPYYQHVEIGYNYRMSNILAGVGRGQLKVLSDRIARRRAINDYYRGALADIQSIEWMPEPEWSFSNRWLSCATVASSDKGASVDDLIKWFADHLIEARHLWKPMHQQPVFTGHRLYQHDPEETPVSSRLFGTGLCFPSGSNMTDADLERIADVTRRFFQR
ncbi:aminotransferase class I/II-fold pyridoxal phosphate-dependent enzyme [Brevundimonas poindexterae]|uniref:aminotransferase class I/II-fold pyridoxal phosphate-dependent enzyme n=1 Tax=Brevundimonas poindexterae TaxID=74325 RepID=UPI00299DF326|nr:aminotransferase class I/II-fold pyridoxal phosphate-dependent enzyme [Brevundimonas poindexterae]